MTPLHLLENKPMLIAAPEVAKAIRLVQPQRNASGSPATPLKTSCTSCHLRELCLPGGLAGCDVERLDNLMFSRRNVKQGQMLYREGDKFQFIYAVRSGTFKSCMSLIDGREQVSGFFLAGEVMGLDGAAHGAHSGSVVALEDSEVCAIPYGQLIEVAAGNTSMQHIVSRLMSREIVREHSLMGLLGSMNAEERLSTFLLNLSQRLKARGFSACEFHLRMSRAEIGSYLGLKLETVSRTFSAFQQRRLLEVDKRHIRITDMEGLARSLEARLR
jgi:CRP/FNR family transcriptional regulator, anaerobic regulatory protein